MREIERNKTQKLIRKIETGVFDENDIDILFMKLRAYSIEFPVFREISDFVAHNDLRNKGISNQSLETMYLRMKFFLEYNSPKKTLDLSNPFPLWIKRLIKFQIGKIDEEILRNKFNVTKHRLISRIENGFRNDNLNKIATYKQGKLSSETFNAIQHAMSFINGNPAFTQSDMINELINVLKKNKIIFNENSIYALSNKITMCILLLFHKVEFDFKGYKPGSCEIACEKELIAHNIKLVDDNGNEVEHYESFGNLYISGKITLNDNGKDISISHSIMPTDLDTETWCNENLFHIGPLSEDIPNHMFKKINLRGTLTLDNDFKLSNKIT
ncbi:MAG: hypothetical protein OEY29_11710 [Gammaproteobacteria bacterium]|nr:hypothetical protein [Gammaproteobacteria bacterium]